MRYFNMVRSRDLDVAVHRQLYIEFFELPTPA
jgi:hypothetical protein